MKITRLVFFQPQWKMWDEAERDKWVQEMPRDAISLSDLDESMMELYQSANLNPDKFLKNFAFGMRIIIKASRLPAASAFVPKKACIATGLF